MSEHGPTADDWVDEVRRLQSLNAALVGALEALDAHYRTKIVVHDEMLKPDHPLVQARDVIKRAEAEGK